MTTHTVQVRKKTADEVASEEAQFKKELAELDLKEDHGEEGDSFLKDFIVNKVNIFICIYECVCVYT
jgi:hypothetical protein